MDIASCTAKTKNKIHLHTHSNTPRVIRNKRKPAWIRMKKIIPENISSTAFFIQFGRCVCVRACLCLYRFLWTNDSECTLHTHYTISPPKRVCCVQMYFIPMPAVYPYACICVCIEFACTVCVEHSALLFYQNDNKNNQYRIWRCFFNLSIWVNCTDDVCCAFKTEIIDIFIV